MLLLGEVTVELYSRLFFHVYRTTLRASGSHSWAKTSSLMQLTTVMFFNILSIVCVLEIWLETKLASDVRPLDAVLITFVVLVFHYSAFNKRFEEIVERYGNIG